MKGAPWDSIMNKALEIMQVASNSDCILCDFGQVIFF